MGAAAGFGETISEGRTSAPMHPIYFDFDRFNIRDDMKPLMEENALFLLDHPGVMIEIQGNCDERGTNEYNLALGERRAKGAQAYLVNLGINPDRIGTVSFGEERPLSPGQNEKAWAKNRRDDFVIIK
jgi:peptidoglycan-associated lipoprotein